jgi:hypothetical protein
VDKHHQTARTLDPACSFGLADDTISARTGPESATHHGIGYIRIRTLILSLGGEIKRGRHTPPSFKGTRSSPESETEAEVSPDRPEVVVFVGAPSKGHGGTRSISY